MPSVDNNISSIRLLTKMGELFKVPITEVGQRMLTRRDYNNCQVSHDQTILWIDEVKREGYTEAWISSRINIQLGRLKMNATERNAVKIRPMVRSDIDPLLAIWWNNIPKKEMVASQQGGPLDLSFIAELEGHLVGFVLARLEYQGFPITGVAVIHTIAVEPGHQGQGIGSLLVDRLQSHCKAEGIQTMRALIPQHDTKLTKLFEHLGFRPSITVNFDKLCGGEA